MPKLSCRSLILSLLTLLATALVGCSAGTEPGSSDPAAALKKSISLARQNDLGGLFESMLPPAELARVKTEWADRSKAEKPSEAERRQFAETMQRLTAPNAAEALFAEYEPDLKQFDAQYRQQMPAVVAMGSVYLNGMIQKNEALSQAEKDQATQMIDALAKWVQSARLTDPDKAKQALAIVTELARKLDLKTLDQAQALSFDQAMPKLGQGLAAFKQVLDLYGLSIDSCLDSVQVTQLAAEKDTARLKVSYRLLDTPIETTVEMVRIEDRWYRKDLIEKLKTHGADADKAPAISIGG